MTSSTNNTRHFDH